MRASPFLLASVLPALVAACAAPDAATAPHPSAAQPGVRPALAIAPPPLGVAAGVAIDGAPLGRPGLTAWDGWTTRVGARSSYVMWFTDWSASFQGYAVTNAYARRAVPVITWEMKSGRQAITYGDVLAGRWNKYLDTWAAAARADARPVFVRLGHEMNGDWYGWSGARNGADSTAPRRFVDTWRYVHGRFAKAGVTNVTWVWCPNHESVPAAAWNAAARYYPGDAYVDWTCADGYNWGTSQTQAVNGWTSRWQTFAQIFGPIYGEVQAIAPDKPMMLGEFASAEAGGDKAGWITDAAAALRGPAFPNVRAFVWFNYQKETDWRVESSAASLAAFQQAFVRDGHFAWK